MSGFADCIVDPAILSRARRGDMKAHEVLYRAYGTPVYTLASRMLQNHALADEVLQDTSIEVIRKLDGLRDIEAFPGWVKRIAVNKCLGHLRSAWHRLATHMHADDGEAPASRHEGSDAGRHTGRVQGAMDLANALALLPPVARSVVWLHDVEGYTHREIADFMGKTTSFSKSQLSRAHFKLRNMLGDQSGDKTCTQQQSSY